VAIEILKRSVKTSILQIAPETDPFPEGTDDLARYIPGKSGAVKS